MRRRLSLYLGTGRKYALGVRYVRKMAKHYGRGDAVNFLKYAARYMQRTVRDDDVAKFRAAKTVERCYGSMQASRSSTVAGDADAADAADDDDRLPSTDRGGGEQPRDPAASTSSS